MSTPQLTVSAQAAKRIRHFDCWVFRDELVDRPDGFENGAAVELIDPDGAFLAHAFYGSTSHIAARVVSAVQGEPISRELLEARIRASIARRAAITGTNAKRLIFSEADGMPGLIVDAYGDHLVLQSRLAAIDRWKPVIVDTLRAAVRPAGILERSDKEFREDEGLGQITQVLAGEVPPRLQIEEASLRFWVDPHRGHKTGFYLDQRESRARLSAQIRPNDRVADVFAYTGAFGVAAAVAGAQVVCVEQSETNVALAQENTVLNRVQERVRFVTGDAFYWLEATSQTEERFDWVLLDPPGLAKSKADLQRARQGLHKLVTHALALLAPGGRLVLSVCTYHLLGITEEVVRIAAEERGVRLQVEGITVQAPDHPWIAPLPMTRYLMSWWLRDARLAGAPQPARRAGATLGQGGRGGRRAG